MKRTVAGLAVLLCGGVADAQAVDSTAVDPAGHYEVYRGSGEPADLGTIVSAMAAADVVFLGEQHNDPIGHALQLLLLEAAEGANGSARRVILGMEMFERDVQTVLDEYLAGYIRETDFLKASRPWGRYETDYKPLVDFAKAHGFPVIATNAPARYTSMARRRGLASLDSLSETAQLTLPLGPVGGLIVEGIPPPSALYEGKFRAQMEEMGAHGAMPGMPSVDDMLVAQNLRDVSMAYWVARQLDVDNPLVVHVNGSFHSAERLGIPEHLARFAHQARMLVVTMRPEEDFHSAPESTNDDFIILTDQTLLPDD